MSLKWTAYGQRTMLGFWSDMVSSPCFPNAILQLFLKEVSRIPKCGACRASVFEIIAVDLP